jgi:hypothetical protein
MTPVSRTSGARRIAVAALAALAFLLPPARPARAAIETDPVVLYATMKKAYDTGQEHGWSFAYEQSYISAIFDAGRAYSLFRPTDPNYGQVANLAVEVATQLHYDPLISDDASEWYVREAADYVLAHGDPAHVALASTLIAKLHATDATASNAARTAQADAAANAQAFPHDGDALVQGIVADVRAYNLTHDKAYRSDALHDAANPTAPLLRVPQAEFNELFDFANGAMGNDPSITDDDHANAKAILDRRKNSPQLQEIARVHAMAHDVRMTRTAPADEYFGQLKISPLGVRNEINHINTWLDAGWGTRMAHESLELVSALDDWQHQYPHDATLPQHILDVYKLLDRMASDASAHDAAEHLRHVLLVEYANSSQARSLAAS